MANRTLKDAKNIHGTNPQYLVEKIIRSRIYDSQFWKESCFALTAELMVDKAMELRFIGGVYGGNIKPTPFICLVLKFLQIQPEKDIVIEFIKNEEFKYVRALGAFYLRLTASAVDCYKYLEPLYNDYRKIRRQNRMGQFEVVHMDEFIDDLLREERVCDVILPRIQKRSILEENGDLEPKVSLLDDDLDQEMDVDLSSEEEAPKKKVEEKPKYSSKSEHRRSRSTSRDRYKKSHRRDRSRSKEYRDERRDKRHSPDRKRRRSVERSDRHRGYNDRDRHRRERDRSYDRDRRRH
jgi:pre-mRNA-splicing factor 38A